MNKYRAASIAGVMIIALAVSPVATAQNIPPEYQKVLQDLGRKGDYADGVLKVGIPRNDLTVTVAGVSTPTSFGFGGWVAFTRGDGGMDVMMGDLVLLQDEVNPVMSALLENGLEVTALHNHFFWEEPRVFYMHVHGHGNGDDLARKVKPAMDLIGHVGSSAAASAAGARTAGTGAGVTPGRLDAAKLNTIIGHTGGMDGAVYKVVVGRPDLEVKEMGATINARMGLNSWAAIVGSDDRAAIAGDIAMKEEEVQAVLKALRNNGLDVVAIHHHMTGARPMIIFLHYWGTGPADNLAKGFAAALGRLGENYGSMH